MCLYFHRLHFTNSPFLQHELNVAFLLKELHIHCLLIIYLFVFFSGKFMSDEIADYEIGKRHVANIMGLDPETISQEDIDVSLLHFHVFVITI